MNEDMSRSQLTDFLRSVDRETLESTVMRLDYMFVTGIVTRFVDEASDGASCA